MNAGIIIVAGGSSTRMNGINKQFASLCGMPVIKRTAEVFLRLPQVSEIVVVAEKGAIPDFELALNGLNVKIVDGGATRALSAKRGFEALSEDVGIVAVHDGARPLTTEKIVTNVLETAEKYGAAIAAVKSKDTVKIVENGFIKGTPCRDCVYSAQTPQAFTREIYKSALNGDLEAATDDASLVEKLGIAVKIVDGDYTNIKITTPDDLLAAELILKERLKCE